MKAGATVFQFENRFLDKNGTWRVLSWNSVPQGELMYAVARDVTERKLLEHALQNRLQDLSERDPITGVANFAHLRSALGKAMASDSGRVAAIWLELRKFRTINNVHGQPVGDALLTIVATRLRALAGDQAMVGRTEGGKFLLIHVSDDLPAAADQLAARLAEGLAPDYELQQLRISVDPKMGIAVAPEDGNTVDLLLGNAHLALLRARADDAAAYRFFAPDMDHEARIRRALEVDLGMALRNGELEVEYQPLVDIVTQQLVGSEALLRWHHPVHGSVSPAQFIPIAEESGVILAIGEWVLGQACRDAATWPAHLKVAVNLSAVQFRTGNLVQIVSACLDAAQLDPVRLELEITESVLLSDNDRTFDILTELKAMGVRISMDDFGTGYSSLAYLQRFPFDKIKIDQAFVRGLNSADPSSRAILRAVARVGASLGMATLAEGIETEEQLEIARLEGYQEAQGFLFGRSESAARFAERARTAALPEAAPRGEAVALHRKGQNAGASDADEEARLRALYHLDILDTPAEECFDRITRLARAALNAPMAMISLVDRDRQWFKSKLGVATDETPRDFSFCTHTIAQPGPLVVRDTLSDARFRTSPLVTAGQKVRAYAGVPLRTSSGHNIGALCVNDVVPRDVTPEQIAVLQDLAQLAIDELELRRIAETDSVTGVMTARRFYEVARRCIAKLREEARPVALALIDIDGFQKFNRAEGHAEADRALALVAGVYAGEADADMIVARLRSDKFVALMPGRSLPNAVAWAKKSLIAIQLGSVHAARGVTASAGVASLLPHDPGLESLIKRADAAADVAKLAGGNCVRSAQAGRDMLRQSRS